MLAKETKNVVTAGGKVALAQTKNPTHQAWGRDIE
jgi:hypothetical protein